MAVVKVIIHQTLKFDGSKLLQITTNSNWRHFWRSKVGTILDQILSVGLINVSSDHYHMC